jgi:D-galactarolactone cycloisomerase
MLVDQRIESVDLAEVGTRYPRTVGRNARLGSHGSGFATRAVRVRTADGVEGWGVAEGDVSGVDALVGLPVGEVFRPEVGLVRGDLGWLDLAMHDLAGRADGVPVHTLLGDHGTTAVDLYSGAIYFDDLDPDDAPRGVAVALENCASDWEAGFRAFKLKIGRGHRWMESEAGLARDVEITRAVREAYPDARVLVDANDGFSIDQTRRFLDLTRDCGLYWIEEPFVENQADLRILREHLRASGSATLIADGESSPDEDQLLALARDGLIDVLLMDVVSYGMTAWRRVMPLLAELGVAASPHAWGKPIKTLYAAQLAAGLGNVAVVEGVPGTTLGADTSRYHLEDGVLRVPDGPGFDIPLTAPVTTSTEA